jgi:A/G-specific adenine glycosylase
MPTTQTHAQRNALLAWYDAVARDLPWRKTRDPYAIWVSEVMLQQTRVDTVVGYYGRFLERFPTPQALAAAPQDAVMAAWSGLGYYRRARLLHAGVREVVERYGGLVPDETAALRALPGVGRYTAGAIGSIAFDRREPVVDGNVARVLCRLFAIDTPPQAKKTLDRLWREAERLVQGPRPGHLNQALMELGATLCSKRAPNCSACPLRSHCRADAQGRTAELPVSRVKTPPMTLRLVALVATRGAAADLGLWLGRGEESLFSGLWNLPMSEGHGRAAAKALLAANALSGQLAARPSGEVAHVLTHRKLNVQLWRVQSADGTSPTLRSVRLSELTTLGISKLTHKAIALTGLVQDSPCLS